MLFIIRGAPGSGKSTYAKELLEMKMADVHFETDMFFMRNEKYDFKKELLGTAHQWCYEKTKKSLKDGLNVVVSNTFTKLFEIMPYIDLAEKMNISYKIYHCVGKYDNLHGVPLEVVEKKRAEYHPFHNEIEIE